jgi:hypothetical protein
VGKGQQLSENSENSHCNKAKADNLQSFLFPTVFKKDYTGEVHFKLVVNSDVRIVSAKKVILDKNKNFIKSWSDKFGDYFLQPFASYRFSPVLFTENKGERYVLKGVIQNYTAFSYLAEGKYFLRLKFKLANGKVKLTDIPFFVLNSNSDNLTKTESDLIKNKLFGNVIVLDNAVKKGIVTKLGVFYSYDYNLETFSKFADKSLLLSYLKKHGYKFVAAKDDKLQPVFGIKNSLEFVVNSGGFTVYKINFEKREKADFKRILKLNSNFDSLVKVYFNKKHLFKPICRFKNKSFVVGTDRVNSYLMVAFANGKLWEKKCGYMKVDKGYYAVTFKARSLTGDFKIYPQVIFYNKDGEKIKSVEAKSVTLKKGKKEYSLLFKNTYTPFFTRSVFEKKPIAKGFKLPYFYSDLFFVDKDVKTIAIGLYFYKDKGILEMDELNLKKLDGWDMCNEKRKVF